MNQTWRVRILLGILGFVLTVTGCESVFPPSRYPPPPSPPPLAAPPPSRPLFYVNASRLNLRACPGMDCPKVATLERNEKVEQVAETEDWIQVRVKRDGNIGWVAKRYLSDRPVPMEMAPGAPGPEIEPQIPERATPERPPVSEPLKPAETYLPGPAPRPAEAAEPEPLPSEPEPVPETPAPPAAPAPVEKPLPVQPQPEPEPPRKIRIM